ncbi:MAG: hypothetical protein ABIG44_12480 [Planctomycetota bacterium]
MSDTSAISLRTAQIIILAMILGMLLLSALTILLNPSTEKQMDDEIVNILLVVLAVATLGALGGQFVIRTVLYSDIRKRYADKTISQGLVNDIARRLLVATLISGALLEACGLFGAVIYLISSQNLALIATGLAILVMLTLIPTQGRLAQLVTDVTGQQWP